MPNQRVKNGLKAIKTKFSQMVFFLKKKLKFSCTYQPLSFCNIFKKNLILSYEDKHHFRDQNGSFVLNKHFLVQTILITFVYLLALFTVQNLKKFLQRMQNYGDAPFLGPKWSICPKNLPHNIILIYLLAPFILQNLKNVYPADPVL